MPIMYQDDLPHGVWQQRRQTVQGAIDRIIPMLNAARTSVMAVRNDVAQRNVYQYHFGDIDLRELQRVRNIIALMDARVTNGTLIFHYVPTLAAFNHHGLALPPGIVFNLVEAFVVQTGAPALTPLHVYFGPSFFTGNVHVARDVNVRTGTGTFLHELSHGVGATADHAYTWEGKYANLTPGQRATNADSYRAYCQGFDVLGQVNVAIVCAVCNANFDSRVRLRAHQLQTGHQDVAPAPAVLAPAMLCGVCNANFGSNVLLQAHRIQMHH